MRKQLGVLLIGMAASIASLSAQGSGSKADQIVILGCLQSGPQNSFTLKDARSGRSYRIDADAEAIGWHVGHELEIHGALQVRGDEARIKAEQIVFIATRCSSSGSASR